MRKKAATIFWKLYSSHLETTTAASFNPSLLENLCLYPPNERLER